MVTMEVVKYIQSSLINSDLDMYYDKTDTPAVARSSSLIEELGQVGFVFSDKTGTLTCNEMEFRQSSIAGLSYADKVEADKVARDSDDQEGQYTFRQLGDHLKTHPTANVINEFLILLSTCHTVIPEKHDDGEIVYQASSPDEGALVKGASMLGYKFHVSKRSFVPCSFKSKDHPSLLYWTRAIVVRSFFYFNIYSIMMLIGCIRSSIQILKKKKTPHL